ncbi:MAG: hypothetical protein CMP48_08835 [Rickettsiales bacterium]|nr:hypothetical protein [Rickettsiales bacterium]
MNMKLSIGQISIILLTLVVVGCFSPDELSEVPRIGYVSSHFYRVPDDYVPKDETDNPRDSILITFTLEDGDGDIGLRSNDVDNLYPYHPYNTIIDSRGEKVRFGGDYQLPFYKVNEQQGFRDSLFFSDVDNRPTSYDCKYFILDEELTGNTNQDSAVFIEQNIYGKNLIVDILRKQNGNYTSVDYAEYTNSINCDLYSLSGRIPIFDDDNLGRTLKGEISYSIPSTGHVYVLNRDTFKIRFYVFDRALNQSNVVESPDLTLQEILVD